MPAYSLLCLLVVEVGLGVGVSILFLAHMLFAKRSIHSFCCPLTFWLWLLPEGAVVLTHILAWDYTAVIVTQFWL